MSNEAKEQPGRVIDFVQKEVKKFNRVDVSRTDCEIDGFMINLGLAVDDLIHDAVGCEMGNRANFKRSIDGAMIPADMWTAMACHGYYVMVYVDVKASQYETSETRFSYNNELGVLAITPKHDLQNFEFKFKVKTING